MERHVVVPSWPGRPAAEGLEVAAAAARLGYGAVWVSETSGSDAGVLAGRIAGHCPGLPLVLGPLPAPLRSAPQLAMLAGSLHALGTPVELALGASQARMTEGWHGRGRTTEALLRDLIEATRAAAAGRRTDHHGAAPTTGFRLRLPPVDLRIGLAALGPRYLQLAGALADRVVLNMVPASVLPHLLASVDEGAASAGRPRPPVTAWVLAGCRPTPEARTSLQRFVAAYASAGGYADVFRRAGFGPEIDALHRPDGSSGGLLDDAVVHSVAALGDAAAIAATVASFEEAGVSVAIVPLTIGDPGGARTLRALAR
ncbi:MAG: putative F420-dependent oxidoreductase [Actinomycetia bacterium]|nr:putative F420-dependent oxidoreductase [Actinomycetes bacterium]